MRATALRDALKFASTFASKGLSKFALFNSKIFPKSLLLLAVPGNTIVLVKLVLLLSKFCKSSIA